MKTDGISANIARNDHRAMSGASGHSATELVTSLAMMHATLESTTDAILVTDETNCVREFNERYIKLWGIPAHMMVSAHATELWNCISPQLKDPARYLASVQEIVTSSAMESFDVLELKDGRVFGRNSAIQLVDQRSVGRVWSIRVTTLVGVLGGNNA
jgi:two-component system sensor histidine kinase/response regulator